MGLIRWNSGTDGNGVERRLSPDERKHGLFGDAIQPFPESVFREDEDTG
jgi:hypothetical protein